MLLAPREVDRRVRTGEVQRVDARLEGAPSHAALGVGHIDLGQLEEEVQLRMGCDQAGAP